MDITLAIFHFSASFKFTAYYINKIKLYEIKVLNVMLMLNIKNIII